MFDACVMRRLRRRLAALSLACAAAPAAGAQGPRAIEARLDSLAHVAAQADAALKAHNDSVSRVGSREDTVIAGPVRLVVSHSLVGLVSAARDSAMRQLEPAFGTQATAPAASFAVFPQTFWNRADSARYVGLARIDSLGHRGVSFDAERTVTGVTLAIQGVVQTTLSDVAGTALGAWLGGPLPLDTASTSWLAHQRLELASVPARAARQCYDGSLDACGKTLGLVPVRDAVMELYDPASRRDWVRLHAGRWGRGPAAEVQRCLAGDDPACVRVMRGGVEESVTPLDLHAGLMQTALALGGRGAYKRLLSTPLPPAKAIAAVAGVPADSVVETWHARVIGARTPSSTLTGGMAAASMFWIVLCAGLGLRSSRWR